jgi:hypothetical protein
VSNCKSRLSAIARSCYLRALNLAEKYREAKQAVKSLEESLAKSTAHCRELENENHELCQRVVDLEAALAGPHSVELPLGDAPRGQQYGANMIALCVNLARKLGIRPTVRALEVFFEWLGVEDMAIPSHETVRLWMQRVGLGRMRKARKKDGGTWLVDHTNQIGKEKVLTILRVRSRLRAGVALRHQDVEVLATVPGTEWKREDVAKVYEQTEKRYGTPRCVATDGAVELREPAENLGKSGKRPLVFRDPKHFLANRLEALLKRDPNYEAFTQKIGRCRSAVQQTELARFVPPGFRTKARFMNLEPTIRWASAVLWHLNHPESSSCSDVSLKRLEEKLGWLRDSAPSIEQWQTCLDMISTTLTFLNQQGVFPGVVQAYQRIVASMATCPASKQLTSDMKALLREYEKQLQPHERLRISTEVLESTFSRYKQLEQQHSKSGFTSLLLAFPALIRETTQSEVTNIFANVKVSDVKAWTKEHLPDTLTSQRQRMFREAKPRTKPKERKRATPLLQAA